MQKPYLIFNANRPTIPRARIRGSASVNAGFTIVEAMVAMFILMVFLGTSTYSLMSFNDRAARNRNGEAARAIAENYVDQLLASDTAPAPSAAGTDLDGDGITDGVNVATVPLIVQRNSSATISVSADIYESVTAVGTSFGLTANTSLVNVQFMVRYMYRGQYYYYKVNTLKATT